MSNQQIQKVKVKRLAHVGLWATDIPAQARFYRQVLGFDLRLPSESAADQGLELDEANMFLALGEEFHSLGFFHDVRAALSNGRNTSGRSQLHHLAFAVDTDAELAALAARLKLSGVDLTLESRDGNPDAGDTLWFHDPDGNHIEIMATPDESFIQPYSAIRGRQSLRPFALQHVALRTTRLEEMVEFYCEALGFDVSDWLLRERVWLRCNTNHHTLMLMQDRPGLDHVGYTVADGSELLRWADYLSQQQVQLLWGPGRHGVGGDLFIRFADAEDGHIELSAGIQQYYDLDVTTPPRLWHTRSAALNLWGVMPSWVHENVRV